MSVTLSFSHHCGIIQANSHKNQTCFEKPSDTYKYLLYFLPTLLSISIYILFYIYSHFPHLFKHSRKAHLVKSHFYCYCLNKNNSIHQINRVTANRSHDQLHKTTPSNPHATNHAARLLTKLVAWNIVIKVFSQKIERYKDRIRHLLRWRYCMRPGSGTGSSSLAGVLGDGVFWVLFCCDICKSFPDIIFFFLQKGRRQSENSLRASITCHINDESASDCVT